MKYHSVKPCHQFIKCDTKLGLLTPGSLIFRTSCGSSFLPVGRIWGRFCPKDGKVPIVGTENENVLVVNPLQQNWVAQ